MYYLRGKGRRAAGIILKEGIQITKTLKNKKLTRRAGALPWACRRGAQRPTHHASRAYL